MLTLSPECHENRDDYEPAIKDAIIGKPVDQVAWDVVQRAFDTKSTEPLPIAPMQPEPVEGRVLAKISDDGSCVLIKVEPPMGRGRRAELHDVMEAINNLDAGDFYIDIDKIDTILTSFKFRDYVMVAEKRDGAFEINSSSDATEVSISVSPPHGGANITVPTIVNQLKKLGIQPATIKMEMIERIVKNEIFNESVVIAFGTKPVDGADAYIEYYFDTKAEKPRPTINEEGFVDFKDLNIFQTVKAGDPVAKKTPATKGVNGMDVYGTPLIAKDGKDCPPPVGLNVKPGQDDPNMFVASVSGQPKIISGKVNVVPILEIKGNVDFSTGNISFTGSVKVQGNVVSGFSIKAMGDVEVGGVIEMATIECGGSLVVKAGIVGQDKALIMCRGNINAKFIDKATVYADGDIYIEESILYSKVSSSGKIVLAGKKGFIMGGITRASKSITCNQLGSPTQTPTIIEIGGSPTLRAELEQIELEVTEAESSADNKGKSLETAEKLRAKQGGQLTPEQQERILIMTRERFALLSKIRAFKEKKEDYEEKLTRLNSHGLKVNVKTKTMPGVKICIRNTTWIANDPVDATTFREHENEITFSPFENEE